MKVSFFEDDIMQAIGAGVYGIYIESNNKSELLYIGQSISALIRNAWHLYKIKKGNGYLGFDEEIINSYKFKLNFKLLQPIADKRERENKEKRLITILKPKLQSGLSDRVKDPVVMKEIIKEFLKSK